MKVKFAIGPGMDSDESIEAYYTIYPDEIGSRHLAKPANVQAARTYYLKRGDAEKVERCDTLLAELAAE